MSYLIRDAVDGDYSTIHATHPALGSTYVCYAFRDGEIEREPVILWAVLSNGLPEPVTMSGVWNGTPQQANMFVEMPCGRCSRYEESWPSAAAAEELRKFDRSES